jgi:hypothetical protein
MDTIVLQEMGKRTETQKEDYLLKRLNQMEDELLKTELLGNDPENSEGLAQRVRTILGRKGDQYKLSIEYALATEDDEERIRAYQNVEVTDVMSGSEQEIKENPYQFLNLNKTATFGEVRARYLSLSKMYHSDVVRPQSRRDFLRFCRVEEFPVEGQSFDDWFKKLGSFDEPEILSAEEIEGMDESGVIEYNAKHATYQKMSREYEQVREAMQREATKKLSTITRAFKEIKDRTDEKEVDSFAGFHWTESSLEPLVQRDYDSDIFDYRCLYLEGEGEIRRFKDIEDKIPSLFFDFGDVFLGEDDYRQHLELKPFFAWTELVRGQELSPPLLDDVVTEYNLSLDQAEQLRVMIMDRVEEETIIKVLNLPKNENDRELFDCFFKDIKNGPTYRFDYGPLEGPKFPLGVEFFVDGSMTLRYVNQHGNMFNEGIEDSAHFTKEDVQIMTAIAYGPLLMQPEE